jgi:hypothetical protein
MKTLKIKRAQVIKALRQEPLAKGKWIEIDDTAYDLFETPSIVQAKKIKCRVCAVGAVLRHNTELSAMEISRFGVQISDVATVSNYANKYDIEDLLAEKNYLGALSAYFESTIPLKGSYGRKHRERLVRFVKGNFPALIEVRL